MNSPTESSGQDSPNRDGESSSPDGRNLAFLVHSQDSVLNNLPPNVDNKPLARQKRRRTSPEDQQILEDEFRRNSKPDKVSRMAIVSKVALGEKEVQIWFQNRRQNSRRKSRPLDADAVISHLDYTSTAPSVAQMVEIQSLNDIEADGEHNDDLPEQADEAGESEKTAVELDKSETEEEEVANEETNGGESAEVESQSTTVSAKSASSSLPPQSTLSTEPSSSQGFTSSQEAGNTFKTGYLANRRSASFVRHREEFFGPTPPSAAQSSSPVRAFNRSSSYLRLSMTEDGQARVVDRAASPSPPRSQNAPHSIPSTARNTGLRRSYSAAGLGDMFNQAKPNNDARKVPRVTYKSRDSRAWEFWCDSDARNSLAEKAEQEASGSAADAIHLIRQSSKGPLRPNARKANTPVQSPGEFIPKQVRPGLKRASTTHGRLQQQGMKPPAKSKKGEEGDEWERPATDSDKENWEPEEPSQAQSQIPSRRVSARPAGRSVLGENTQVISQNDSLGALMDRERKSCGKVDGEVAEFMGESVVEDLDCVQSLLSLSQGNWR